MIITLSQMMHLLVQLFTLSKKSVDYDLYVVHSKPILLRLSFVDLNLISNVLDLILVKEHITFDIFHYSDFML